MSARDRDTLAGIIADEIMKMPYAHKDTVDPLAARVADVLLASDWLREQRAEAFDAVHDGPHCVNPNPYRTTENTDG